MSLKASHFGFQGEIDLEKEGRSITLTVTPDVFNHYFGFRILHKYEEEIWYLKMLTSHTIQVKCSLTGMKDRK